MCTDVRVLIQKKTVGYIAYITLGRTDFSQGFGCIPNDDIIKYEYIDCVYNIYICGATIDNKRGSACDNVLNDYMNGDLDIEVCHNRMAIEPEKEEMRNRENQEVEIQES